MNTVSEADNALPAPHRGGRIRRLLPAAYFLALTTAVVYPWFQHRGLLFILDFVWPPELPAPTDLWRTGLLTSLPHEWLWWLLSRVVPTAFVQKLALSLPLFLSGLAMFHLTRGIRRERAGTATLAALTSGTFYALNSFVVTRVFMGQLYLLYGYALTPWALLAFLKFRATPSPRRAITAALTAIGVMISNGHHLILLPLLLVPFAMARWRPRPSRRALVALVLPLALFVGAVAGFHRLATGTAGPAFHLLGPWARALRAPFSGNLLADVLTLTATWKVDLPFAFPYEILTGFGFLSGLLLAVAAFGTLRAWRHPADGPLVRRLLLVAALASFLAIGVAHHLTEPTAAWLYQHVPFWIGLRDSAKFFALLALVESVFLGLGITALAALASRHRLLGSIIPPVLLALTLYTVSPALGGFGGQVYPSAYPASWYEWNRRLGEETRSPSAILLRSSSFAGQEATEDKARMLFLPWHLYLPFSFTADRTVANPAPKFFTNAEVIAGDNSEVGGTHGRPFIFSESHRPLSKTIEVLLREARGRQDFGAQLAPEGIRYVALANDTVDAGRYSFLRAQPDLRLVFDSTELTVWAIASEVRGED